MAKEKEAIIKEYEAKAKKKGHDKKKEDVAKSDEAEKEQKVNLTHSTGSKERRLSFRSSRHLTTKQTLRLRQRMTNPDISL